MHEAPPVANLVLIVNDAMRRDRVGSYGGPATPVFDRFARDHILFLQAYAPAPWTKPSIASLFTSLHPSQHQVATHPGQDREGKDLQSAPRETDVLSGKLTTLAEVLRDAGYRTAALVSNPWMARRFGFDQGFETYDDSFARWGVPGAAVSTAGLAWLKALEPGQKFFMYLHYLDTHRPHGALRRAETQARALEIAADPRPLSAEDGRAIAAIARFEDGGLAVHFGFRPSVRLLEMAYDRGIEEFDQALGSMLQGLQAMPAWSRTAVIITSDHGEALFSRGWGNHGISLYDDEIAIPLAARLPGVGLERLRFSDPVSLVDVMPTVCTYLGLRCGRQLYGTSLVAPAGHESVPRPRYIVSEGVMDRPWIRSIRNRAWKLVWDPYLPSGERKREPYLLFNIEKDPGETRNLMTEEFTSPQARRAFAIMAPQLGTAVPPFMAPARELAPIDPALAERLRALGYAQ